MSSVYHLSLLHGIVYWAVLVMAGGGLAVAIVRRSRRWWAMTLPILAVAAAAIIGAFAWSLRHSGTVKDHYPPTFALWTGLFVLALLVAVAGWPSAGRWRRAVAIVTVPLTAASAFLLVNTHYGYWPTVGDLMGGPLPDQLDRPAQAALIAGLDSRGGNPLIGGTPPTEANPSSRTSPSKATPALTAKPGLRVGRASPGGAAAHGRSRTTELAAGPDLGTLPEGARRGVLTPLDIPTGTSGFVPRQGSLYLPPAFFDTPHPDLPVMVMLSGTPGGPDAWPRAGGVIQAADVYAARHGGVAPILAFVDHNGSFTNDTECVDGPKGNAETFLSFDTPHFLAQMLGVALDPRHWAIGGFSEGGTCALELGLRHPDVYGTFLDLAGDSASNLGSSGDTLKYLYGGSKIAMAAHDPVNLLRSHAYRDEVGWFIDGASDTHHVAVARSLAAPARAAGIVTSEVLLPGGHNWQFAAAAFRTLLPTIAEQLGAVPPDKHSAGVAGA